ncbi:hypothetical protein NX059_004363 [Plenodomus lindquistii]|nr:hypothetical protein NX059_004363 [Plenodomus lindquistii]
MSDSQSSALARVEAAAIDGRLRVLRIRQRLFRSLHSILVQRHDACLEAIQYDENCSLDEAKIVYGSALIELRNHYDALDLKTDLEQEYRVAKRKSNEARRKPIPIAYIIPSASHLFYSVLVALGAAIEAGSCVVVELEQTTQKTPALLRTILHESLDRDAFTVVYSRAPPEYLAQCVVVDQDNKLDSLSSAAQRVLSSPVARNVAIVDRTSQVELAAQEIVASRMLFGGASLASVDLVLVNEFVLDKFKNAVVQSLQKVQEEQKATSASTKRSKSSLRGPSTDIDRLVDGEKVRWVHGNSELGLVEVLDRTSRIAGGRRAPSSVIVIHSITSLDDPIDFLNTDAQRETPTAALYVFSEAREAKYLSQYIDSQVTYVNHIPAQSTVGPRTPLNYPANLRLRYTRDMFEIPSPEIVPGDRPHMASKILKAAAFVDSVAMKPLKPTGQPKAEAWGFFETGMMIGAFVYIIPAIALTISGVSYGAWKGYKHLHG